MSRWPRFSSQEIIAICLVCIFAGSIISFVVSVATGAAFFLAAIIAVTVAVALL